MGKPYQLELGKLPETYCWAISQEVKSITKAINAAAHLPLIAVGSGGSLSAAEVMASCGQKVLISQLYVSRFEAFIFSDYHEFMWKREKEAKGSTNYEEALRWMKKSEDLAIELAREKQNLFETVGMINVLFPRTKQLVDLSSSIYHHKIPLIKRPEENWSAEELTRWRDTAVKQTQDFVQKNITTPIDDLVVYLE